MYKVNCRIAFHAKNFNMNTAKKGSVVPKWNFSMKSIIPSLMPNWIYERAGRGLSISTPLPRVPLCHSTPCALYIFTN